MTLGDWHCDRVFFFMLTITTKPTKPKKKTYLPWGGEGKRPWNATVFEVLGFPAAD